MGDSPDVPTAPNLKNITKLLRKSANQSFKKSQEQFDWAKQAYADNKEVSDLVIDRAIGAMDKQEAWADEDRARYQSIFQPLEEQLAAEAESYATPERLEHEAGKAEADVAAQFAAARQTAQDRLEGYGVDPSQTRSGALDLGSRIAEAAAQASAGNQARTAAENVGRALRSEAINVGRGYPGQALAEQTGSTSAGNQAANTGLATTASGANTMGTGMQWAQLGQNAATGWGNLLNQQYANQMKQFEAENSQSSGWGDILGTAAGVAGSFLFDEGGAIPDEEGRMLPHEMSPSNGAIPDDIDAEIDGETPARLNAGEFVMPKDVVSWLGEKGMQQLILKARKEMTGANGERPAQPEMGPMPPELAGAIPG
jgi:hypothetical protein